MLNAKLLVNKIGTPLFAVLNPIFLWESQSTGHPIVMHRVQIVFWGAPILVTITQYNEVMKMLQSNYLLICYGFTFYYQAFSLLV